MPIELTEVYDDHDADEPDTEPEPRPIWSAEQDWYLDHIETRWLTARAAQQRFGRPGSTFATDVSRDAFGLRSSRRKAWTTIQPVGDGRRYFAYEYPLWRVNVWSGLDPAPSDDEGAARDAAETVWLTPAQIEVKFGRDRTTFQRAVSRNVAGLREARRRGSATGGRAKRGQCYQYPLWRLEEWAGESDLTLATVPSIDEVKRLRSQMDAAASLLAREVGFSPPEVRTAAQIGDLAARIDPNTSKVLFLPPGPTRAWIERDSWKRTG